MTNNEQVLPTSTTIEDDPNADGSITRTTTTTYTDGSKTTKQEAIVSSSTSDNMNDAVAVSNPDRARRSWQSDLKCCLGVSLGVSVGLAAPGLILYFIILRINPCGHHRYLSEDEIHGRM